MQGNETDREREGAGFPDVPNYYVNFVRVSSSVYDFVLVLGQQRLGLESPARKVTTHASVSMSPQHALVLAGVLNAQLETYEKQFGPIPTGPEHDRVEGGEDDATE